MPAAVDVGTNTVRLLIGRTEGRRVFPQHYFRRITRLGGGLSVEDELAAEAMDRTLAALREVAALLKGEDGPMRAVGTAVLRSAANGVAFVERIREETGISLEIIGGEEEARLSALGVLSALAPHPAACLIVDIGGGSTEFILWRGEPLLHRSYPLGVVRLTENLPDPAAQKDRIAAVLAEFCADLHAHHLWEIAAAPESRLIGTAGTVTTLAALSLGMAEYDWRRVNNLVMDRGELQRLLNLLEPLSVAEREAVPGMEEGRGDLIVPGLRIVLAILERFGRQSLTVSDFGLLEGILLDLEERKQRI